MELKVIDTIIKTYFDNLKNVREVTFDDINTVIYSAAVTMKEHLKDVKSLLCKKLISSFLLHLLFNWRTFSRRVTALW